MRSWLADDLDLDLRADVTTCLRGEVPTDAVMVAKRYVRRVLRLDAAGQRSLYVKQHLFPSWRRRLRYALRASPTRHERRMLEAAKTRAVIAPQPVAEATHRGLLGPVLAVLVTRALPEGRAPRMAEQIQAVLDLASLGFYHRDLHADNIRVLRTGRIAYLDFQSCRLYGRALVGHKLRRMLVVAAHDCMLRLGREEMARELAKCKLPLDHRQLVRAVAKQETRRLASLLRHALRNSSMVRAERVGFFGKRLTLRQEQGVVSWPLSCPLSWKSAGTLEIGGLGPCSLARNEAHGITRLMRRSGLRKIWLAARVLKKDLGEGILGWERNAPWPFGREYLYISDDMTGAEIRKLLETHLAPGLYYLRWIRCSRGSPISR